MENNKALAEQPNQSDEQPKIEATLTGEQLEEVTSDGSHRQIVYPLSPFNFVFSS